MITKMRQMTVEEYLAFDEGGEIKHEFVDGELFEMTGGTANHSMIIVYAIAALVNQLNNRDCIVFDSNMRVKIDDTKYVYPDVSVVCGNAEFADDNEVILLNPTVVVEVTSPSSIERDRVSKVEFYGDIPSVLGYLILDQERVFAQWYTRIESGWHLRQFTDLADEIELEPLGCTLSLAQLYRGVNLEV